MAMLSGMLGGDEGGSLPQGVVNLPAYGGVDWMADSGAITPEIVAKYIEMLKRNNEPSGNRLSEILPSLGMTGAVETPGLLAALLSKSPIRGLY